MVSRNAKNEADLAPRNRASGTLFNSVSNRIILCVFFSTLLTALIVSWLSIRAIHADVHKRTKQRAATLLEPRVAELASWRTSATSELAGATSIGSPWHAALLAALENQRSTTGQSGTLPWKSESAHRRDGSSWTVATSEMGKLPVPPPELRQQFDRIDLYPADGDAPNRNLVTGGDCFAAQIEFFEQSARVAGRIEACLERDLVVTMLHSDPRELRGMRVLLVDEHGVVRESAGVRGARRLGATIALIRSSPSRGPTLGTYEDERANELLGLPQSIDSSGWSLVAESDRATAFAPAIAITNQIVVVDICIIILFSLLAHQIARALMAPIAALSEGAQRIAAGNVDYQIPLPLNRNDELGRLTGAFNKMMANLRSNQLVIEEDRFRLAEKNDELQHANEILSQLSITDGLTKLHNHRYFQDNLSREMKRVSRTRTPLSLILLDIDDFKMLNDTHGHAAGDEVLVSLASIMNESARESDLIARYGGEEFVVLMPNTDLAGAVHLAEKIRMAVEGTRLIIGENMKPVNVTISVGVALYSGNRRNLFVEADKALYQAKAAGKNCVIIAGSD